MSSSSGSLPPVPLPPGVRRMLCCLLLAPVLLAALPGRADAEQPPWQWPLPPPHSVVAGFEAPEHRYGPGHRGIDIAAAADGATVGAVDSGTVRFSGMVAGRGVVSVTHADGLVSTYEPVRGVLEAGSVVEAGAVLGTVEDRPGSSHCPDAACLHLGARRGAEYVDPLLLLGMRGPSVLLPWGDGSARGAGASPLTAPVTAPGTGPAGRAEPGATAGRAADPPAPRVPSPSVHRAVPGARVATAD
jgi:hypothetical protein